jgi:hypothetical protein
MSKTEMLSLIRRGLFFFCLGLSLSLSAQSLEKLEVVTSRYETLNDFLNDPSAIEEYRIVLKLYLKEEVVFDPVFDRFFEQIKDLAEKIPEFAKAAWKKNPNWQKEIYSIKGEHSGTGLEIKRDASLSAIDRIKIQAARGSGYLSGLSDEQRNIEIKKFVAEFENFEIEQERIRNVAGFLRPEQFASLSRAAKAEYKQKMGLNKTALLLLKKNQEYMRKRLAFVSADLAYDLMNDEIVSDKLFSGDADIIAKELEKFGNFKNFQTIGIAEKFKIPSRMLEYLSFSSETLNDFVNSYKSGIENMKEFQKIADPRMSPGLVTKIQDFHAEGIEMSAIRALLDETHRAELDSWVSDSEKVREEKKEFRDLFENSNRYFFYELHEDTTRATLRLKNQAGTELFFKPTPRAFHAFFAGRKKGECVGGATSGSLTPRRWAVHALEGAQTIFVESGDGKMEGYVGLTPIRNEKTGEVSSVVDIMSHAIKGDIILKDKEGFVGKKSFFDEFIEEEYRRHPHDYLVISDGNSVSMNVGAAQVVQEAPAYVENVVVGKPGDFSPVDPMSEKIVGLYSGGMYSGGMIYDGMKKDGTKVLRLIPSYEQKKKSRAELEEQLILRLIKSELIGDKDSLWKIARNSGVRLKSLNYYRMFSYSLRNLQASSVDQFTKTFMKVGAEIHGPEFDPVSFAKNEVLFLIGRLNAVDAFSQKHINESLRMIRNDVKEALQEERAPHLGWDFIQAQKKYLNKDPEWSALLDGVFQGYLESGENVFDLKSSHMQNFKKLMDLDVTFYERNINSKYLETEILKIARDRRRIEDRIDNMAQFPQLALEAHPSSKAFFEIELMRLVDESKDLKDREVWTILNLKDVAKVFNDYPNALLRLIEVAEQSGDLVTLFSIAKNEDTALSKYPHVKESLGLALERCISSQRKDFSYLVKVVNGRGETAASFRKVFYQFPNALLRFMELNDMFLHFLIVKNEVFEKDLNFKNMFVEKYLFQPQGKKAVSRALEYNRIQFVAPLMKAKRKERLQALLIKAKGSCRSLLRFLNPF